MYQRDESQEAISVLPFHDSTEDYRIGACLQRDGLLIYLHESILAPSTRANFLAILLRSIPDYFNLDDGEQGKFYFKLSSFIDKIHPEVDTTVEFEYEESFDHKRNQKGYTAFNIRQLRSDRS